MHELSIAQNIISIVQETMRTRPGCVKSVHLKIGSLSNVVVESLRFGFETLIAGTELEGARLAVEEPPVVVRCRTCAAETTIEQFELTCASCGGHDLEIIGGDELFVQYIEIEEDGQGT